MISASLIALAVAVIAVAVTLIAIERRLRAVERRPTATDLKMAGLMDAVSVGKAGTWLEPIMAGAAERVADQVREGVTAAAAEPAVCWCTVLDCPQQHAGMCWDQEPCHRWAPPPRVDAAKLVNLTESLLP